MGKKYKYALIEKRKQDISIINVTPPKFIANCRLQVISNNKCVASIVPAQ